MPFFVHVLLLFPDEDYHSLHAVDHACRNPTHDGFYAFVGPSFQWKDNRMGLLSPPFKGTNPEETQKEMLKGRENQRLSLETNGCVCLTCTWITGVLPSHKSQERRIWEIKPCFFLTSFDTRIENMKLFYILSSCRGHTIFVRPAVYVQNSGESLLLLLLFQEVRTRNISKFLWKSCWRLKATIFFVESKRQKVAGMYTKNAAVFSF
jgi:hypothetical protein